MRTVSSSWLRRFHRNRPFFSFFLYWNYINRYHIKWNSFACWSTSSQRSSASALGVRSEILLFFAKKIKEDFVELKLLEVPRHSFNHIIFYTFRYHKVDSIEYLQFHGSFLTDLSLVSEVLQMNIWLYRYNEFFFIIACLDQFFMLNDSFLVIEDTWVFWSLTFGMKSLLRLWPQCL